MTWAARRTAVTVAVLATGFALVAVHTALFTVVAPEPWALGVGLLPVAAGAGVVLVGRLSGDVIEQVARPLFAGVAAVYLGAVGDTVGVIVARPPVVRVAVGTLPLTVGAAAVTLAVVRWIGVARRRRELLLDKQRRATAQRTELKRQADRLEAFASVVSHDLRNPIEVARARLEAARASVGGEGETDASGDSDAIDDPDADASSDAIDDPDADASSDAAAGPDAAASPDPDAGPDAADPTDHDASSDAADPDAIDDLDAVDDSLDRMEEIIDDALALARIGPAAVDSAEVSLADVARTAWDGVATGEATLTVAAPAEAVVVADETYLRRLFENLFRNAAEHAGPAPTVTVETTETGFRVDDDGPGIPPDRRDEVTEAGHTTATAGTGFGLSIVEEIAAAHGWQLSVEASETGGARFAFTGVETGAARPATAGTGETDDWAGGVREE